MRLSHLMLGAPPAGAVAGALAWLLFSHGASATARIDDLQSQASALAPTSASLSPASASGSLAASSPIFALTTGPGAVADTTVELVGVARTPTRTAALLAIDGKTPEWVAVGETRDDVTLDEVGADRAQVDTPTGTKDIVLGAKSAAGPQGPQGSPSPPLSGGPPPSVRLPPPPASAPRQ